MAITTHLLLMRHGTTEANIRGLFLGQTDVPLSDHGRLEAAALGRRLSGEPLDLLIHSDLERAGATARAIASRQPQPVELRPDPRLREMHLGDFEGLPAADIHRDHPTLIARWRRHPADTRMPGLDAESLRTVQARAFEAIQDLVAAAPGATIGVVAHTFTLIALICRLLDLDLDRFRRFHLDRASITRVDLHPNRATLRTLNDIAHNDPTSPWWPPAASRAHLP